MTYRTDQKYGLISFSYWTKSGQSVRFPRPGQVVPALPVVVQILQCRGRRGVFSIVEIVNGGDMSTLETLIYFA